MESLLSQPIQTIHVMLHRLHLKNVGPAPDLDMNLAPRLNLVTGDR